MKLVESRNSNLGREPKLEQESLLPDFFYIQSSSTSVNNSFMTVRDGWGQVPIGKGVLAPRLFSITGNVEAESSAQVEKMRSSFMSKMFGKDLWLKVDDADDRWIWVRLDGAINITYNAGVRTSRVFTFSFTLKAPEGVSYGERRREELIKEIAYGKQPKEIEYEFRHFAIKFPYNGNIGSMPFFNFYITEANDAARIVPFSIIDSKVWGDRSSDRKCIFTISCSRAYIEKKCLPIQNVLHLFYKNGCLQYTDTTNNNHVIKDVPNINFSRPLLLRPKRTGYGMIYWPDTLIDWSGADSSKQYKMILQMEWRPIYF